MMRITGEKLSITAPDQDLPGELWRAVEDRGPELCQFVVEGWEADARARARACVPGRCAACGCALKVLPWEDPRTAICLDCCRRQYLEDEEGVAVEVSHGAAQV